MHERASRHARIPSRARGLTGVTYTASRAPGYDYVGEFVAFDPVKGTRAWEYRPPSGAPMTASALATAGGIVFGGTADRQFFALHSDTGELLWQMRLNGDISGAPVTFEHAGKQYVAVGSGGRAAPTTTLGRLVGIDVPQGSGVMWVFALPDAEPTPIPRPVRRDLADALGHGRRVHGRASLAGRGAVQPGMRARAIRRAFTPAETSPRSGPGKRSTRSIRRSRSRCRPRIRAVSRRRRMRASSRSS